MKANFQNKILNILSNLFMNPGEMFEDAVKHIRAIMLWSGLFKK